ncbi:hypothetical protein AYI70_g10524, partial [Smittium culicis]
YEAFGKHCNWTDIDNVTLLDLFLEERALIWYKSLDHESETWDNVKEIFNEIFKPHDDEIDAWSSLQSFSKSNMDIMEMKGTMTVLFQKANITDDKEKFKYLLRSVELKDRRELLKGANNSWNKGIEMLSKREKLDKLSMQMENPHSKLFEDEKIPSKLVISNDSSKTSKPQVRHEDAYEQLLNKFDALNLNLVSWAKTAAFSSNQPQQKPEFSKYVNSYSPEKLELLKQGACFYCKQPGHRKMDCPILKTNSLKPALNSYQKPMQSNINCLEFGPKHEEEMEMELLAVDKRKAEPYFSNPIKKSKENSAETINVKETELHKPRILAKKHKTIQLMEANEDYSIKKNLSELTANISIAQLLQHSPNIRYELMKLCKTVDNKTVNSMSISPEKSTNCRGLVKIFDKDYWAVIDTGAACSVMSSALMEKLGLAIDNIEKHYQLP